MSDVTWLQKLYTPTHRVALIYVLYTVVLLKLLNVTYYSLDTCPCCTGIIIFVLNLSIWTWTQTRDLPELGIGRGHVDQVFVAEPYI
jgi:hypothetical protein